MTFRLDDLESDARNITDLMHRASFNNFPLHVWRTYIMRPVVSFCIHSEEATAWPRRPKPEISTSSFSSMKFKQPSLAQSYCCCNPNAGLRDLWPRKPEQQVNPPNLPRHQQRPLTEPFCHIWLARKLWNWSKRNTVGQLWIGHSLVPDSTIETCHRLILTNLGTNAAIFLPFLISWTPKVEWYWLDSKKTMCQHSCSSHPHSNKFTTAAFAGWRSLASDPMEPLTEDPSKSWLETGRTSHWSLGAINKTTHNHLKYQGCSAWEDFS